MLIYVVLMIVATAIFIGLFHTAFLDWLNVFFYRGVVFLLISSLLAAIMMWGMRKWVDSRIIQIRDIFTIFFVFLGFTSTWFVLVPVTVERSVSVFMLSYMAENSEHGIDAEDFGKIFYQKYIVDFGAFDKRFYEQITSKNMESSADGHGYVITENGRRIVDLFRTSAKLFNTEKWLVYPNEYTGRVQHDNVDKD